jgi:hypothetical protein
LIALALVDLVMNAGDKWAFLRFKTYDEMNAWLLDKCVAYAPGG